MRLLIHSIAAKSGGATTYISNLAETLATLGEGHEFLFSVPAGCLRIPRDKNETIRVIPTEARDLSPLRRFFWDQVVLRRLIRRQRIDLLVSSSDFGMLFPPCRQILLLRNALFFSPLYLEKILPRKSAGYRVQFLLRRWLIRLSTNFSDRVLIASQSMCRDVQRFISIPQARMIVNPFGVPLERFTRIPSPVMKPVQLPFRLLYVSEYGDYKNLATLLKAIRSLRQHGQLSFQLVATADPDQFPQTEAITRQEDKALASHPLVAPVVSFAASVPYGEISRLYLESDLFVFPSLAESFGHPLVEAMASGLPILASDIPICREICGEAAWYFQPFDFQGLAEKILLLARDPRERERLGQAGRKRAEARFQWRDHVRRLLDTFEQLGGESGKIRARGRVFSYRLEREYYSRNFPKKPAPYRHLEPYLRCWLNPENVFKGRRILDIGAGECAYTRLIAERFAPREIVACELLRERMAPAAQANQDSRLRFVSGECLRLPFRDSCFDVVFGSLLLHQIPNLHQVVEEIRRVLSGQGHYVGIEPNPWHPVHLARYVWGNHSPNQYLLGPQHLALFKDAGFEIAIRYFYAKLPGFRNRFLGTCMGIIARLNG